MKKTALTMIVITIVIIVVVVADVVIVVALVVSFEVPSSSSAESNHASYPFGSCMTPLSLQTPYVLYGRCQSRRFSACDRCFHDRWRCTGSGRS